METVRSMLEGICWLARRWPHLYLTLALALVGLATLSPAQTKAETGPQAEAPLATISVLAKPLGHQIPKDFVGLSLSLSWA